MSRRAVQGGVYVDEDGGYWVRPWIRGKRTWRKLCATREREAIKEANRTEYEAKALKFQALAALYLDAGCPNSKLEGRATNAKFCDDERGRMAFLLEYFGSVPAEEIRLHSLPKYAEWRKKKISRPGAEGGRTIDLDLNTLSNVISYGVALGQVEINYIRSGRPLYRKAHEVRHCVEVAPRDSGELNRIVDHLFMDPRSEATGWMALFAAMTGCRRSELLRLRLDAALDPASGKPEPGFIQGGILYIRRSKRGINPKRPIGEDLGELLECFFNWHSQRFPESPWFFPGVDGKDCITKDAFGLALRRACISLELHHITPHGLRSFYVTKRRREGAADSAIAEEIGDKEVSMVQRIYGDFIEGAPMTFRPSEGLPAWHRWFPTDKKIASIA